MNGLDVALWAGLSAVPEPPAAVSALRASIPDVEATCATPVTTPVTERASTAYGDSPRVHTQ